MTNQFSRRNFLTTIGSTAAAITLPQIASAVDGNNVALNDEKSKRQKEGPIKILCNQSLSAKHLEQIRAAGKNINLIKVADANEMRSQIADAEVVLGQVSTSLLPSAKELKWIQSFAAGMEGMSKELKDHPCAITNM